MIFIPVGGHRSVKEYFFNNFGHEIKNNFHIKGLSINTMAKCHLARILKDERLQDELTNFLIFLGVSNEESSRVF